MCCVDLHTVICWLRSVYDVCDGVLVLRSGLCSAVGDEKSLTEIRNRGRKQEIVEGFQKSWTEMRHRGRK